MKKINKLKTPIYFLIITFTIISLMGCGSTSKWVGTYDGTSTSGAYVKIKIERDGIAVYENNRKHIDAQGTWMEKDNDTIILSFNGEVSSSEPLIVKMMNKENSVIMVDSDSSSWNPDYYSRVAE